MVENNLFFQRKENSPNPLHLTWAVLLAEHLLSLNDVLHLELNFKLKFY